MKRLIILFLLAAGAVTACKTKSDSTSTKTIKITMEPRSGSSMSGTATFKENKGKVSLTAHFTGMKPGVHAIHIHEKSDCTAADGSSAGGHWNPTFQSHGKWGVGSYHKGDIGNFAVNENGEGTVVFETDEWCIGCGDPQKDITGKSLMVHADPDDMQSQPAGNAGDRIACSAIIK